MDKYQFFEKVKIKFPAASPKELKDCFKYLNKYYNKKNWTLILNNIDKYFLITEKLEYPLSLQHYLYFNYCGYDYDKKFEIIQREFLVSEINSNSIKKIKKWIRKKFMDNELEALMYFRFLLRINNYKEPTHSYANRMNLIMKAQKYNSSDDEIFRNKIEHYKKIDNIKAVDVLGKLEKMCVNLKTYPFSDSSKLNNSFFFIGSRPNENSLYT